MQNLKIVRDYSYAVSNYEKYRNTKDVKLLKYLEKQKVSLKKQFDEKIKGEAWTLEQ